MLEKIRKLERAARQLDPGPEQRRALFAQAGDYAESFLEALPGAKTYTRDNGHNGFADHPPRETPAAMAEVLDFFRREVDTTGILPASGGQMGYIPGGGLFPSALGDFLAGISNRYSGVAFAGPGAARMEWSLVRWMCQLVGYPDGAAGDMTSGGSMATLSALVTARDARGIDPSKVAGSCVYMTAQAHHCIGKALHIGGLGSACIRTVAMDGRYRMDCGDLERLIEADLEHGLTPWLVVGSAGTTDTGAIDPLERITACPLGRKMHRSLCPLHSRLDEILGLLEESLDEMTLQSIVDGAAGPALCRPKVSMRVSAKGGRRGKK